MKDLPNPAVFSVRRATFEDAPAICQVHIESIRVVCAPDYTPELIESWAGSKRPQNYVDAMSRGEIMFVAEFNRQIVGFASMGEGAVHGLYIAPSMLRRGLGRALLAAVEQEFDKLGTRHIQIFSTLTAEPFYLAQGYSTIRRTTYRMGGVDYPCVEMTKDVP